MKYVVSHDFNQTRSARKLLFFKITEFHKCRKEILVKDFVNEGTLNEHLKKVHQKSKKLKCKSCH